MAIHSSILACKIPWTEESGGLQSMGSQRVGHDWACTHALQRLGKPWVQELHCDFVTFSLSPSAHRTPVCSSTCSPDLRESHSHQIRCFPAVDDGRPFLWLSDFWVLWVEMLGYPSWQGWNITDTQPLVSFLFKDPWPLWVHGTR